MIFSMLLGLGCPLQDPTPYPGFDTGEIANNGTEDTSSEPSSEPEDGPTDSGSDSGSGSGSDSGQDTGPTDPNAIELLGNYLSQYGDYHYFASANYTMDFGTEEYTYAYIVFNNAQRWLVAKNGASNADGEANLYSKFFWMIDASNRIFLCQASAHSNSQVEAQNVGLPGLDTASGCNGLPWLELTRQ